MISSNLKREPSVAMSIRLQAGQEVFVEKVVTTDLIQLVVIEQVGSMDMDQCAPTT